MRAFTIKKLFWLLLLTPLLLAGCDNDDQPATLSSISVTPSAVSAGLAVNASQQFNATGTYSDGSVQDLTTTATWNSSDSNVASINSSGLATGLAAGTSNITASSGVTSNKVALNVSTQTLESITVSPPTVPNPVPVGSTVQFKAVGAFDNNEYYDITAYVTWASTDAGVLSIDTAGLATAETEGISSVTASVTAPPSTSNAVSVATLAAVEAELVIEPQIAEPLPANRTRQLLALLRYENESLEDVTNNSQWLSSDTAVATVNSSGLVTGIATGDATITATHNTSGRSDVTVITVNEATIESLTINPEFPAELPAGFHQAFIATGVFSDGELRPLAGPLSWSVSNTDTASLQTISGRETIAVVEGLQGGTVDVIYTDYLADGTPSGISDEVVLTITSGVLQSMAIKPSP